MLQSVKMAARDKSDKTAPKSKGKESALYMVPSVKKVKKAREIGKKERDLVSELATIHLSKKLKETIDAIYGENSPPSCPENYYCFVKLGKKGATNVSTKPDNSPQEGKVVQKVRVKGIFYTNEVDVNVFINAFNSFVKSITDKKEIDVLQSSCVPSVDGNAVSYQIVIEDI